MSARPLRCTRQLDRVLADAGAPSSVTALESWVRPQRRHVDELEIDPHLDHALHAQYPEHLREAADVVVGEVQWKATADVRCVRAPYSGRRKIDRALHTVNGQGAMQHERQRRQ